MVLKQKLLDKVFAKFPVTGQCCIVGRNVQELMRWPHGRALNSAPPSSLNPLKGSGLQTLRPCRTLGFSFLCGCIRSVFYSHKLRWSWSHTHLSVNPPFSSSRHCFIMHLCFGVMLSFRFVKRFVILFCKKPYITKCVPAGCECNTWWCFCTTEEFRFKLWC